MKSNLTFVSYARRSSSGETKQAASIPDQEKTFREVILRDSLKVVKKYRESQSALKPDIRPVYREMVNFLKSGKANSVLIWHVNRISRNPKESGEIQQLLHDGIIQCVRTPERNYYPEDHALLFAVEAAMANQYSRDLRRDVKRGTDEKAGKGWYPHKPKAGYELDPISRELVPDPVRFPLLRKAWELMLTGQYTVPEVLAKLNGMGYRTQRTKSGGNKPMSRSSLYRLFVDPFYTGLFYYLGERFEGKHRAMVSKREFDTVQRILGRSLKVSEKTFYHPFAGLVVCGVCGCQITAETHVKVGKTTGNSRTYTYYHCTGRKGCPKLSIDEANMEGQIVRDLMGCRLDPFFADWALDTIQREAKESEQLAKLTTTTQTSSETLVTRRLESLYAMREDGEITKDEFVERKAKHQEELDQLQEAKYLKETKEERDRETLKQVLIFGKESYRDFTTGGKQAKRAVAQKFSHTYVLTQENLSISKHPALDRIRTFEPIKNQDHQSSSGGPDALIPIWRTMLDSIQKEVISSGDPFPARI